MPTKRHVILFAYGVCKWQDNTAASFWLHLSREHNSVEGRNKSTFKPPSTVPQTRDTEIELIRIDHTWLYTNVSLMLTPWWNDSTEPLLNGGKLCPDCIKRIKTSIQFCIFVTSCSNSYWHLPWWSYHWTRLFRSYFTSVHSYSTIISKRHIWPIACQ